MTKQEELIIRAVMVSLSAAALSDPKEAKEVLVESQEALRRLLEGN